MNPNRIPASASQLLARDRCAEEADSAFKRLIADIYDRPTCATPRTITVTISLAPKVEVDANNRTVVRAVKAETAVAWKVPPSSRGVASDVMTQRGGERHLMLDADEHDPQITIRFPEGGTE